MARFNIRVELHGASSDDYELLHARMAQLSCLRTITDDLGRTFHLPWAEYQYTGAIEIETVVDVVYGVAGSIRVNPSVLVTEADKTRWIGLKLV